MKMTLGGGEKDKGVGGTVAQNDPCNGNKSSTQVQSIRNILK